MQWFTKNMDAPTGKPKVYFSCYRSDFAPYFQNIADQLTAVCNCAIYYYPVGADVVPDSEYEANLLRMNLIVIPVTAKTLTLPNRTRDFDLHFAEKYNIPVLPLLQEAGLETVFNQRFGHLQFLTEHADRTAIPYTEKLQKYLKSVLYDDALLKEIRNAFCAKIFLSYRKKDREHAKKLMSLIHGIEVLRDVAIWYDEFLVPGENYDKSIQATLQDSHLFLLVVTPNILEPENYVITDEYPSAHDRLSVVAAELVPTDRKQLQEVYPGLPDPVDPFDIDRLAQALLPPLQAYYGAECDPRRSYLLGLAYHAGIDVEPDPQLAISLLQEAAAGGIADAAGKLAKIYGIGDRVPRDYLRAKKWMQHQQSLARQTAETVGDEISVLDYYLCLLEAGSVCDANMDADTACDCYLQAVTAAEKLCDRFGYSRKIIADCYFRAGRATNDPLRRLSYRKEAYGIAISLCETEVSEKYRLFLLDCCRDMADAYGETEQPKKAIECNTRAINILQLILKTQDTPALKAELLDLCDEIGDRLIALGDKAAARRYAKEADWVLKTLPPDPQNAGLQICLTVARHYTKIGKYTPAIRLMEKTVEAFLRQNGGDSSLLDVDQLFSLYCLLGNLWELKNRKAKALSYYELALQKAQNLVEMLDCPYNRQELTEAYLHLAQVYDETADDGDDVFYVDYHLPKKWQVSTEKAYDYYLSALKTLNTIGTCKTQTEYMLQRVEILDNIGRVSRALGKRQLAGDYYTECVNLCDDICEKMQTDISLNRLACLCFRLALTTRDRDLMEGAYALWSDLEKKDPHNRFYLRKMKEAKRILNLK